MAKQRNIGSGVVAAARGVSAVQGRFQDVGEQFMTGFDKSLESKRKKEAENKAIQDRVNSYMDSFNNDIDLIKFKPEEQTLVKNKIAGWRNEYADLANQAAAIQDKSSAEYQELIDSMNGIQNRMVNLKNNLDQLAAFKTEYGANIKAKTYSNAGANDMSLAQGEIMYQYPIGSIGDDGNLMWSDEGTGDFNFQDYQMPFEKATGLATVLGKIANPIRMQKTPLDNLQKKEIREQVDNLTRDPKALASLISDSDLPAFDFSNIDPDDPNAREKVVDLLVNSIYDLRGKGLSPSDKDVKDSELTSTQKEKREQWNAISSSYEKNVVFDIVTSTGQKLRFTPHSDNGKNVWTKQIWMEKLNKYVDDNKPGGTHEWTLDEIQGLFGYKF